MPDEYFSACSDYDRAMDRVSWTCPRCGNRDDLRIFHGELGFGVPGQRRFDVHDRVLVPGLRRQRQDLRLDISLDAACWRVPSQAARRVRQPA